MLYMRRWYQGKIIDVEDNLPVTEDFNSSDEEPLSKLKHKLTGSTTAANEVEKDSGIEKTSAERPVPVPGSLSDKVSEDSEDTLLQARNRKTEECYNEADHIDDVKTVLVENCSLLPVDEVESSYDSDHDPPHIASCEVRRCKEEVFSSCHRCRRLLCFDHFDNNESCEMHTSAKKLSHKEIKKLASQNNLLLGNRDLVTKAASTPEEFFVEGGEKEMNEVLKRRTNAQKLAKKLRNLGEEYLSPKTKKAVPARAMKVSCDVDKCKKFGRHCFLFSGEDRNQIFSSFNNLGDLQRQREFIVYHTATHEPKQRTTKEQTSRREKTIRYSLTKDTERIVVCKTLFTNTLGISDRFVRTALSKLSRFGTVEGEMRGGRQSEAVRSRDHEIRVAIESHINRYPRVESHYCRASTTREYLHSDLSVSKMYAMFVEERADGEDIPSIATYNRIFKTKNLSFHRPKKDQCSLCLTYRQGGENVKAELQMRYKKHIEEKNEVRRLKSEYKLAAVSDVKMLCATFDLQQVIYLPISKENAIFYKRRLSNFNLTFYDIASKDCYCFTWHEGTSRRGSSEISTCVYKALQHYDKKGVEVVSLFADGCCGQNKNSIIASMLLYAVVHSENIRQIRLLFFETNHGQSEGDSAHSAISTAIANAGNIVVPSQLHPVMNLARRKNPYKVRPLRYDDFLDFKGLSQSLRLLSVKTTDTGNLFKWTEIMEFKVLKEEPTRIFFKTSHLQTEYSSITLKRNCANCIDMKLPLLNAQLLRIPKQKYNDLVSLCKGDTPVIRVEEHQQFYKSLPYDD